MKGEVCCVVWLLCCGAVQVLLRYEAVNMRYLRAYFTQKPFCCSAAGNDVLLLQLACGCSCVVADTPWCVCAGTKEVHSRCDILHP